MWYYVKCSDVLASCEANFAVASLLLLPTNCIQEWCKALLVLRVVCGEASLVSLIASIVYIKKRKELVAAAPSPPKDDCLQLNKLERDCLSLPVLLS
jgi:hypothetical protein